MVHAYLMYGFPTQTAQETIDSLEMVRQMFKAGILQSAFWHQFTMTAHSPVGLEPAKFSVRRQTELVGSFANNDLEHEDPTGADHPLFAYGLKKSLHNYMHGMCFDDPLQKWFEFKTPKTKIAPDYIIKALKDDELPVFKPAAKVIWLGSDPIIEYFTQSKHGNQREMATLSFTTKKEMLKIQLPAEQGKWFANLLQQLAGATAKTVTLQQVKDSYEAAALEDFELFWDNKPVSTMYKLGLLQL